MLLSNLRRLMTLTAATLGVFAAACGSTNHAAEPGAGAEAEGAGPSWHAETHTPVALMGRTTWVTIREDVRFDAAGRLLHAETQSADDAGSPPVKVTFDPPSRKVAVDRGGRHFEWTVPGDEPWILGPVNAPNGDAVTTPLVAWTTYQAARNAEWVRIVMPLEQTSYVVPRDQYVVDRTVLVGDRAVEVDDRFVRAITIGGVERARVSSQGKFRFQGRPST